MRTMLGVLAAAAASPDSPDSTVETVPVFPWPHPGCRHRVVAPMAASMVLHTCVSPRSAQHLNAVLRILAPPQPLFPPPRANPFRSATQACTDELSWSVFEPLMAELCCRDDSGRCSGSAVCAGRLREAAQ